MSHFASSQDGCNKEQRTSFRPSWDSPLGEDAMPQFEIRVSTQGGPVESAQFVARVARLSSNVRQSDHVLANWFAGHKAEPRPGADEEWLAMTKHDRMDVESILINQIKVVQAPCQVGSGYVDLPIQLGF